MVYQDSQMGLLIMCLLTRSKNRPKISPSALWRLPYNNGGSLANKINDEIIKLKTNNNYYQDRVPLDSEGLLLVSSEEYDAQKKERRQSVKSTNLYP